MHIPLWPVKQAIDCTMASQIEAIESYYFDKFAAKKFHITQQKIDDDIGLIPEFYFSILMYKMFT